MHVNTNLTEGVYVISQTYPTIESNDVVDTILKHLRNQPMIKPRFGLKKYLQETTDILLIFVVQFISFLSNLGDLTPEPAEPVEPVPLMDEDLKLADSRFDSKVDPQLDRIADQVNQKIDLVEERLLGRRNGEILVE